MKTLLAFSPHLDDAVFSAGALLASKAASGWRVVVATCFTATIPNPAGFALACQLDKGLDADIDYMALRRAEDESACTTLGCEAIHLPLPEAPHRGYENARALFEAPHPDDSARPALSSLLGDLIARLSPALILGPAAIGHHVDHVLVNEALDTRGVAPWRWADMPYAARAPFDRTRFEPIPCHPQLPVKRAACACYESQLGFQFRHAPLVESIQLSGAEWFEEVLP